ncbi:hypothetical protein DPMN_002069 [Dreissena polymorpha]|uniref:Uncharacterized protein n=1 Tax=Dreissena polymorpha TaxID=45954 RepID=A0A9D4MKJ9_DREPO|nr:hypothetical protein DPMN_002069 [Dreissena polymorpha]
MEVKLKHTRDRLYIIGRYQNKLLTLARDGTLLATYSDPAPEYLRGQVLVCGRLSNTVLQLANLATREDGVWDPQSVCYSSTTSSIIVGLWRNDNILDKVAEDVMDKNDLNTQKVLDQIQEAVPSISRQSQLRWTRTRQKLSNILRTVRNPAVFYSPSVCFQSVIECFSKNICA